MKLISRNLVAILGLISFPLFAPAQTTATNAPATTTNSSNTSTNNGVLTLPPPDNTVSGTVTTENLKVTNGEVQLTEEQKEKIRAMLKRSQLNDEQKKRQAELLDKTPVLEDKVNPGLTEKGSIPKRF